VNDSTTPAGTPAAGRPFPGLARRILAGPIRCDVCGTDLDPDDEWCPACAQRARRRAGLEAAIDTYGAERPWVTLHRSDENDGTRGPALDESDEPEAWPW
jgi:hypothetical protein